MLAEDEASELEFFLHERPAFVWSSDVDTSHLIIQNETVDVHLHVHGKRGLTHGVMYIYYASIDRLSQDIGYYCRRIEFSLAITVNASLELVTCDFLSLCKASNMTEGTRSGITNFSGGNKFLAVLELRNSWINPLSLELSVTEPHEPSHVVSLLLRTGQTRRVIITFPRIYVPSATFENPIPRRIMSHQFVISESMLKNSVALTRQAWWYRKHILDHLSGTWAEQTPNPRKGNIELRGIRLSERHIQVVRRHEVETLATVLPLDEWSSLSYRFKLSIQNHRG